jgi:hypothetical protein
MLLLPPLLTPSQSQQDGSYIAAAAVADLCHACMLLLLLPPFLTSS